MFRIFERLIDPFEGDGLTEPVSSVRSFVLGFVKRTWGLLAIVGFLSAGIATTEVLVFRFMGGLVDWLARSDRATFFAAHGHELLAMGAVVLVLMPVMQIGWQLTFNQGLFGNFPMMGRWRMHRYLLRQSLAFFQDDMAGRIANTVMQTALAVRETITKVIDLAVYIGVYFIGSVLLMFSADWRLTIPMLLWLAAYICIGIYFVPRMQKISEQQADARSIMTGRIVDSYSNIMTVKLFAHSTGEIDFARQSMDEFMVTAYGQNRLTTRMNMSLFMMNYALLVAMVALCINLWMASAITPGAVAIAIALVQRLQGMSQWILWETSLFFENIGTVRNGVETLSRPLTVVDEPQAGSLRVSKGEIRFDHVRFHYGREDGVLEDFSLTIRPQERVGLVGPSGAGKSTLTSLILRLYDLQGGRLLIDGQDVSTVSQDSLRSQIGMVTQDTALLHRSVADNIRYGRPGAPDEELVDAARRAHAHEFILSLRDGRGRSGYEAHVGERGVNLSGGQRQRIAIARVLLKNAPILLLDEATSALDSEVEAAIQESLAELMRGKTVIAIAHRLSTIARMDRLVVLDRGRIVEDGPHAILVNGGGLYARLWSRQTDGFIAEDLPERESELAAS
jgi:ATP-binding cassette, subfamily B, multidrug efflux pump